MGRVTNYISSQLQILDRFYQMILNYLLKITLGGINLNDPFHCVKYRNFT